MRADFGVLDWKANYLVAYSQAQIKDSDSLSQSIQRASLRYRAKEGEHVVFPDCVYLEHRDARIGHELATDRRDEAVNVLHQKRRLRL
jgi:hypothetical protein